ncbi:hypothetical protein MLD38_026891 [Melastoma candidum]|uniref:Uncharacterized protein n=1 Tax=Melastoma candidum TaxID=119954 RepID=A0ACB9P117_9MYRT|nr:hypothetical protein MLD38_026891 [Melastoma candidum]
MNWVNVKQRGFGIERIAVPASELVITVSCYSVLTESNLSSMPDPAATRLVLTSGTIERMDGWRDSVLGLQAHDSGYGRRWTAHKNLLHSAQ